ncbi:hypothetical protein CP963_09190 [Arcobacter cloacae]|uniref:Lin1244/Lin1753-like N-terminal domain-containing protein n=2 Tax=Arcobacter cloacae TaxID=1054034 RepID=A0AA94JV53_9BACT|nr:hypothetical protein CP963_09190 [Arcobacter cloacae]
MIMSNKKDAYYFSHDSDAKDDPKCMLLIEELGLEGYGIFWVLVETLRQQKNFIYPLKLLSSLARKYNTTVVKMEVVVRNYDLFVVENDTFFFSCSLNKRMELMNNKREQAKLAGIKSGEARRNKKIEQKLNGRSTNVEQLNKSKVNKIKENIEALLSLSSLSSEELSRVNIQKLSLENATLKFIEKIGLQKTVDYAENHQDYLLKEILQ